MPFPWKKVKGTRISKLVNDHLHNSQKRRDGSSLVVETGFPTSLVDLFMKNREKLKKPSKKKRQSPHVVTSSDDGDVNDGRVIARSPPRPLPVPFTGVNEILLVGSSDEVRDGGDDERGRVVVERDMDANGVVLVVLKMFLVMVLALGSNRLAVGVTLSAFFLFFLDYVGKHGNRLLKPCAETKVVLRIWRLLRFKESESGEKSCGGPVTPELQKGDSLKGGSRFQIEEIQVVEPRCSLSARLEEIQSVDEISDCPVVKEGVGYQEIKLKETMMEGEVSVCELAQTKRSKSRRAKIKSKVKKFVAKKLRISRKEGEPERLEIVREDSVSFCGVHELDQWESESGSGSSSTSSGGYKEEECKNALRAYGGSSDTDEKSVANRAQEDDVEIKGGGQAWRYLSLSLVVLIGLIGGRAFALVLTLSWCLLLKIGEKLPRHIKLSWFSDDKSS